MTPRPEISSQWLMTCTDSRGYTINIGAGLTSTSQVAIIGPPEGCALTVEQATEYLEKVRQAWFAATSG